jgi:hypothetical protein
MLRRIIRIVIVIFSILFLLNLLKTDHYIASSELNVRSGAGMGYSVCFTIKAGTEVEVVSKENNWYKIKYMGNMGYVYSKNLSPAKVKPLSVNEIVKSPQFCPVIGSCSALLLLVTGFLIFKKIRDIKLLKTVTETSRGTWSERDLVLKLLKYGIPAQRIFHDLYVKKRKGDFSQIDLLAITDVGIIVFEVKDYKGWIFGKGNDTMWTQVLAYGKEKYRFYNPIIQNNNHIAALKKQLDQYKDIPYYSIVVFYGDCKFKDVSFVPNGTYLVKSRRIKKVMKTILSGNNTVQYYDEKEISQVLKDAVVNGRNKDTQTQHIVNIKDMLGTDRIFE